MLDCEKRSFVKTGSGQTQGPNLKKKRFCGHLSFSDYANYYLGMYSGANTWAKIYDVEPLAGACAKTRSSSFEPF